MNKFTKLATAAAVALAIVAPTFDANALGVHCSQGQVRWTNLAASFKSNVSGTISVYSDGVLKINNQRLIPGTEVPYNSGNAPKGNRNIKGVFSYKTPTGTAVTEVRGCHISWYTWKSY
jgi:hypothetical protein